MTPRAFLLDALPLVASYLSGPTVSLGDVPVEVGEVGGPADPFRELLEVRHAIGCARRLLAILPEIERTFTRRLALHRTDHTTPHGRLDVPRYVQRWVACGGSVQRYPMLEARPTPDAPENALVVQALRDVRTRLGRARLRPASAEGHAVAELYDLCSLRLRRRPWADVTRVDTLAVLARQTEGRLRRRQTANGPAYARVVAWTRDWAVDPGALDAGAGARLAEALLAFPTSDAFAERIFEIWTVQAVVGALVQLGATAVDVRPLWEPRRRPAFSATVGGEVVHGWFQTSAPLPDGRWRYRGGAALRGIPDVVLTSAGRAPALIDAKYRPSDGRARPEETYKMLGYRENFASAYAGAAYFGALVFVAADGERTGTHHEMQGPDGSVIVLAAVDDALAGRLSFEASLKEWISDWLATSHSRSQSPARE